MLEIVQLSTTNYQLPTKRAFASEPEGKQSPKGFTLIELLVVVAIIGLLVGFAVPAYSRLTRQQTLDQAAKRLETDLQYVRGQAISSVDGKHWGIHLVRGSGGYELFSTTNFVYASGEPQTLPSGVTISSIQVDATPQTPANVVFERLKGTTGVYRDNGTSLGSGITITLTLSGVGKRTVGVEAGGKIYYAE